MGTGDRRGLPVVLAWQRATHRLLAELDAALADLGLSAGEVNALACFGAATERTVGELVDATAQRPSTLTGILDRLERRRLVERRPNPADRRSALVVLTADGEAAARRVAEAFAALDARLGEAAVHGVRAVDAALG